MSKKHSKRSQTQPNSSICLLDLANEGPLKNIKIERWPAPHRRGQGLNPRAGLNFSGFSRSCLSSAQKDKDQIDSSVKGYFPT